MSISTFAQLKSAVANWLNRSNLVDRIPEFITMATARIHYGSEEPPFQSDPLRIRAMETSVSATIATQRIQLPTGYLQQRRFYLASDPVRKLDYVTPENFWATWISSQSGAPKQFTTEGEELVIGPTPDGSYTGKLLYYKAFTAFSDETDYNWLLLNAPQAYLHGALIEAHLFTRNNDAAQSSHAAFVGVINALNSADKADRYATPWVARSDTGNP